MEREYTQFQLDPQFHPLCSIEDEAAFKCVIPEEIYGLDFTTVAVINDQHTKAVGI